MDKFPQVIDVLRGQHRLFPTLDNMTTMIAAIQIAIDCRLGNHGPYKPGADIAYRSLQFRDKMVKFPLIGPVERLINRRVSSGTQVRISPYPHPEISPEYAFLSGSGNTEALIIAPIFTGFYEDYVDWVTAYFGSRSQLSSLWHFARIVRNAISHGWKLSLNNPNADSGTWRKLTYSPKDNGHTILGTDMSLGDFTLLMFDLSDDLDRLGCPIPE